MYKATLLTAAASMLGGADAFWRMECPGRVALGRMDPIVNPNELSPHSHAIHGSGGFSESSDTASLRASNCTSCRATQDKSAYWTPPLYFLDHDTGKYTLAKQVGGMLAYYLLYGDDIKPFPQDFRMISGDTHRRNYTLGDPSKPDVDKSDWAAMGQTSQADLAQRAIGFNCLNYKKAPEGTLYRHYLPDKEYLVENCPNGIRFEVMFPSCWNGKDTDSDNHKDHVAYSDLIMDGSCPDSHPVRLPSMLFEVIWDVMSFADRNGEFVIANGDTTGFGMHGDFLMGWDEDTLTSAIKTCTNPSGKIEDCPVFDLIDEYTAEQCKADMPAQLSDDASTEPRHNLPGDVKITYADGSSSDGDSDGDGSYEPPTKTTTVGTLSYKAGETPTDKAKPLPGQVFKESNTAMASAITTVSGSPSAAAADVGVKEISLTSSSPVTAAVAAEATEKFFSTQYITTGHVVSEILWEEEVVTTTVDASNAMPTAASQKKRRMAHVHGHQHHRI